ncbi:MAG: exodeoxyribonuclease VII large subunit [Anaerolineae bacterium]|nr:exodeoxyribonuclease VII large subunit [Anaerolineae bacterium]
MTNTPESPRPIAEINAHIRNTLEREIRVKHVTVIGTVGRIKTPPSGHVYFAISENDYSIPCFLHQHVARTLGFKVRQGMKLEISGTIRVYDKDLEVQIDVERASIVQAAPSHNLLELEAMLEAEGTWRTTKHPLPPRIHAIGLVTSRNSMAWGDFQQAYTDEGGTARIIPEHVVLEGDQAIQTIVNAIARLNNQNHIDVIVLVRGGGRQEELGIFDDPLISKAIFQSRKPIITGLGHADDETLADRVADIRTDNPTRAAILLAQHETRNTPIAIPVVSAPQQSLTPNPANVPVSRKWPLGAILTIIILGALVALLFVWQFFA